MADQFVEDKAAVEEEESGQAVAVDEVGGDGLPEEEEDASFSDSDGGDGEVCVVVGLRWAWCSVGTIFLYLCCVCREVRRMMTKRTTTMMMMTTLISMTIL